MTSVRAQPGRRPDRVAPSGYARSRIRRSSRRGGRRRVPRRGCCSRSWLPNDFGEALLVVADDDDRAIRRCKPAQPGREDGPQRDRQRTGNVAGGEMRQRPDIDEHATVREVSQRCRRVQRCEVYSVGEQCGAAAVEFTEPQNIEGNCPAIRAAPRRTRPRRRRPAADWWPPRERWCWCARLPVVPSKTRWPRPRPPRRQDGHTASMLKTIPLRVIAKVLPLWVMPQGRPLRVVPHPTPLRVLGVGENCRQGVRRGVDLHVARCLTGGRSPRLEAGLLSRRRRSTRCGGDRHRSNRGCKQRYAVFHPRSHGHLPVDMLGMIPVSAIESPSATYGQLRDIAGFTPRSHAVHARPAHHWRSTRWSPH
jgi:hypothetical protein